MTTTPAEPCKHHWLCGILAVREGLMTEAELGYLHGVCKKCGAKQEFQPRFKTGVKGRGQEAAW